jgi:hypothetical protein
MSWADAYIASLQAGETTQFRPRGNSMAGKIESGQLITVVPAVHPIAAGSIVLCKVSGSQYLHLVLAVGSDGRYQIGNNKGHVNGWCTAANVFGVVTVVEE